MSDPDRCEWCEQDKDIGFYLSLGGAIISVIGVIVNNVMLDHIGAMQIWAFSNVILLVYFYGEYKCWWSNGLSSAALCAMYVVFTVTNLYGLWIS